VTDTLHSSSFRDPSGFLFRRNGTLLRQVNDSYAEHYDQLMSSGLYNALVKKGWLVAHEELETEPAEANSSYRILQPELIPFISYPYEWSFSQYQDAALLTLDIQNLALDHGMTLKDASAYNIQFIGSRPVLIDTLSFEIYEEGSPWVAYRQYCQHFLAPLALMSYRDVRLSQLMRAHIDGVPLDLTSELLPKRTRLRFGLFSHLVLHARSQKKMEHSNEGSRSFKVSAMALRGLVSSLRNATAKLEWKLPDTEWGDYYDDTNYSDEAAEKKAELVGAMLDAIGPKTVWDLGANTGLFSQLASVRGAHTVACDIDPVAVEKNYRMRRKAKDEKHLPLRLDLTNPSPALGWNHDERSSLAQRGPADAVIALALIHHLAIGNNVPLSRVAEFLHSLSRHLIIEWVPKSDSQVKRLLSSREDIFPNYDKNGFEEAFTALFKVDRTVSIEGTERTLYALSSNGPTTENRSTRDA